MPTDLSRQARDTLIRQFPKPEPVTAAPEQPTGGASTPPDLPAEVFGPWQAWIDTAAKAASAPAD